MARMDLVGSWSLVGFILLVQFGEGCWRCSDGCSQELHPFILCISSCFYCSHYWNFNFIFDHWKDLDFNYWKDLDFNHWKDIDIDLDLDYWKGIDFDFDLDYWTGIDLDLDYWKGCLIDFNIDDWIFFIIE